MEGGGSVQDEWGAQYRMNGWGNNCRMDGGSVQDKWGDNYRMDGGGSVQDEWKGGSVQDKWRGVST